MIRLLLNGTNKPLSGNEGGRREEVGFMDL